MTDMEKNLFGACLDGEKSSWDAFVLQYSGLVYHTIKKTFSHYHTEPRLDVVEDLFQDFLFRGRCNFIKLFDIKLIYVTGTSFGYVGCLTARHGTWHRAAQALS